MKRLETPILFLIFNRPEPTAKVFAEIRKAQPRRLFIAADGPRKSQPNDKALCDEARDIAQMVDWDCEVKTLFREENLGCKKAVSGAIDWFFEQAEEGIILEDDCLPDPSFFEYASEMLVRYRDEKSVMLVSGSNLAGSWKAETSYIYSKFANIWGWATWKRAWAHYERTMSAWDDPRVRAKIRARLRDEEQWKAKKWTYESVKSGKKDSWAYIWEYTVLKDGGASIVPRDNLIENVGFSRDATHTAGGAKGLRLARRSLSFPLKHPVEFNIDQRYDALFAKKAFLGKFVVLRRLKSSLGRGLIKSRNKLRELSGRLRGVNIIWPNNGPLYYLVQGDARKLGQVVDVGCGFDADFSMYMIQSCGLNAIGIDPTRKHFASLKKLSDDSAGKFKHLPLAISSKNGTITFNESVDNVSGSIMSGHKNVQDQEVRKYDVESVDLVSLPKRLGVKEIPYLKLDLEGAEYDLIASLKPGDLDPYKQLFIEFHHFAVPGYTAADTTKMAAKIRSFGFKAFTITGRDYLFFK